MESPTVNDGKMCPAVPGGWCDSSACAEGCNGKKHIHYSWCDSVRKPPLVTEVGTWPASCNCKDYKPSADAFREIVNKVIDTHKREVAEFQQSIGLATSQETVLEEAARLTGNGGERNDSYDHPHPNFSKIAAGWSVIFGVEVTPRQLAHAMIWMKVVRDTHKPKRDNIVDIAGYARCIERLEEWPVGGAK